jgi:hypothetical protein
MIGKHLSYFQPLRKLAVYKAEDDLSLSNIPFIPVKCEPVAF